MKTDFAVDQHFSARLMSNVGQIEGPIGREFCWCQVAQPTPWL